MSRHLVQAAVMLRSARCQRGPPARRARPAGRRLRPSCPEIPWRARRGDRGPRQGDGGAAGRRPLRRRRARRTRRLPAHARGGHLDHGAAPHRAGRHDRAGPPERRRRLPAKAVLGRAAAHRTARPRRRQRRPVGGRAGAASWEADRHEGRDGDPSLADRVRPLRDCSPGTPARWSTGRACSSTDGGTTTRTAPTSSRCTSGGFARRSTAPSARARSRRCAVRGTGWWIQAEAQRPGPAQTR